MDTIRIEYCIEVLRDLLKAQRDLDKARAANSELLPRRGIRGGRATTLEARHSRAAEYRDRMAERAEKEVCLLFGLRAENG